MNKKNNSPLGAWLCRAPLISSALLGISFGTIAEAKELPTSSLEERLALKKIAQYWNEHDYSHAKNCLIEFPKKYKHSPYAEQMQVMLGNLYFSEKDYRKAVEVYHTIPSQEYQRKVAFNHLHALYELGEFEMFVAHADLFFKDPLANSKQTEQITFQRAEACRMLAFSSTASEQQRWAMEAITSYEQLEGTPFASHRIPSLAGLYALTHNYPKAAQIHLQWARQEPQRKEELLFQAASYQLHYDKKEALRTFDLIIQDKGALEKQARYNVIALLFQMERYADVITAATAMQERVPEDKKGQIQYYVGRAFYHAKEFEAAAEWLEEALANEIRPQQRQMLMGALLECVQHTKDLSLCDRVIQILHHQKEGSPLLEKGLQLHAQLCRHQKEWKMAREDLEKLLRFYPEHPQKEELCYDVALLLMQEGYHAEALAAFTAFATNYPDSPHFSDARKNQLHLTLKANGPQEQLVTSIEQALCCQGSFSDKERKELKLLLAQTYFAMQQYDTAAGVLSEYTKEYHADPSCKEAFLLLAGCYENRDDHHYVLYAQQAITLDPHGAQSVRLHQKVFNACLRLAQKSVPSNKEDWIEKAADHLFQISDGSALKENQRWLASYYLKSPTQKQRAVTVLERLLGYPEQTPHFSCDVEVEALRLAALYQEQSRSQEALYVLEGLVRAQKHTPDEDWKYQRMAQFELGKAYAALGKTSEAIDIYQELISSGSHQSSYFSLASELEVAKLRWKQLSSDTIQESIVMGLCDTLKEIQLKRQLCSEPLHIEAGLEYAAVKAQLAQPSLQKEKQISLLEQVKKSLSSIEPQEIAQLPEKTELIKHYLSYIDIELSFLNGETAEHTKERLRQLLSHVSHQTLKERIERNLEELKSP